MLTKESFMDRLRAKYGRICTRSMTVDEFDGFDQKYKAELPCRFFLLETIPDFLRKVKRRVINPIRNLQYAVFHRTLGRFHMVNTHLEPGYYDKDTIMLHANFSLLVDLVEVEHAHIPSKEDAKGDRSLRNIRRKSKWIPMYHLVYRSATRGVNELEERVRLGEAEIDEVILVHGELPEFAKHSLEALEFDKTVLKLYRWWTEERPTQWAALESMDPMAEFRATVGKDVGGMSILSKKMEAKYPEAFKKVKKMTTNKHYLEMILQDEDQEMLMELIKIRRSMWT